MSRGFRVQSQVPYTHYTQRGEGIREAVGEELTGTVEVAVADTVAIANLSYEGVREDGISQSLGPMYIQEGPEPYGKDRNERCTRHAGRNRRNDWGPYGGCALRALSRLSGPRIPHSVICVWGCVHRDPRRAYWLCHTALKP